MKNEIIAVIFACSLPLIVIVIAVIVYLSYKNDKREEKWLREEENKYCERISSLLNNIGFVAKKGFYENGKSNINNLLVLYNDCEANKKYRKLKMREDRRNSNNANDILVPALTIIMSVLLVIAICNM